MTDPLVARLREVLVAAQRRYRTSRGVVGALTTIPIPDRLIDEVAAGLAPVLRDLVREAVDTELEAMVRRVALEVVFREMDRRRAS